MLEEEEGRVMDIACLLAPQAGVEEHVSAAEALAAGDDNAAICQLIGLLLIRVLYGSLHRDNLIRCNVRRLLLAYAWTCS